MRIKIFAVCIVAALMTSACTSTPNNSASSHSTSASPTSSPSPSPTPTVSDGWIRLSSPEIHLRLEFPPLEGKVTYAYNKCPGAPTSCDPGSFYLWEIDTKAENGDPWRYMFAGSTAQQNAGRSWWPTDIREWGHDAKGYWIYVTEKVRVDAVTVVQTPHGSALIFKPRTIFCDACGTNTGPDSGDRVAALNLSEPHNGFKELTLYFAKQEPLSTIKKSLASIAFG